MTRKKRANQIGLNPELATEAKAIVALAFRNGPTEDVHAGKPCPTCSRDASYSRISDEGNETYHEERCEPRLFAAVDEAEQTDSL